MPTSSVGRISSALPGRDPDPSRDRQGAFARPYLRREPSRALASKATLAHARGSESGVTLVEMVVVLAIVGLIAGVSFPSISAGLESVRMVSATDSVATFLNSAVNRAERRQQAIALVIQPKEGLLALYSTEPGFKKELRLPESIVIEVVQPPVDSADPREPRRFLFLPGATIPGIGIQLGNRHNAHRLVRLDPMTGFPRVESVAVQ